MSTYCNKNIIECLNIEGIYPNATSKSVYNNYVAQNAINYKNNILFNSGNDGKSQWWIVDFSRVIALSGYSISVGAERCNYIKKWKVLVSLNKRNWISVDSPPEGHPSGQIRVLNRSYNARYLKIESIDGVCNYAMAFTKIYFYGLTSKVSSVERTCFYRKKINYAISNIIFLFCSSNVS